MESLSRYRDWAIRGSAAVALLMLGVIAIAQGIAQVIYRESPSTARVFAPWFAPAHAREAELSLVAGDRVVAKREAMIALRHDATLVAALRTLAGLEQGKVTDHLLRLAELISRRDLPTQLTLLQRSVDAGDVSAAISYYDQALRTSETSWPLLLPILARASADPKLVGPIADRLVKRPQWLFPFYREWIKDAPDTNMMVKLSQAVEMRGQPFNRDVRMGLLSRLVAAGDWASIREEMSRIRPACADAFCVDGGFRRYGNLLPVDWSPGETDRVLTTRTAIGKGNYSLDYSFQGNGDALLTQRLVLLAPGTYAFSFILHEPGESGAPDQDHSDVMLSTTCANKSGATLSGSTRMAGTTRLTVATVPSNCPAQWLTLRVRSVDDQLAVGRISDLRINAMKSS